jgi:DNA-binding NtrC family response regulator
MARKVARRRRQRAPLLLLVDGGKREYHDALTAAGYRVTSVEGMKEALAFRPRPRALIVELVVPEEDLSHLAEVMKPHRRTRAMTVIALAGEERQEAVVKAGAAFCRYPCPPEELVEIVKRVVPLSAA